MLEIIELIGVLLNRMMERFNDLMNNLDSLEPFLSRLTEYPPYASIGEVLLHMLKGLCVIGIMGLILAGIAAGILYLALASERLIQKLIGDARNDRDSRNRRTISRANAVFSAIAIVSLGLGFTAIVEESFSPEERMTAFISMMILAVVLFAISLSPILSCDMYDAGTKLRYICRQLLISIIELYVIIVCVLAVVAAIVVMLFRVLGSSDNEESEEA